MKLNEILLKKDNLQKRIIHLQSKPNFSTISSITEVSSNNTGSQIAFTPNDSIRNFSGFKQKVIHEAYILSDHPVDILPIDNFSLECNIAQWVISKKKIWNTHNITMVVDPGYKYFEKYRGEVLWFMMKRKDSFSSICFKLRKENNQLVSFNDQRVTFRLSFKKFIFWV